MIFLCLQIFQTGESFLWQIFSLASKMGQIKKLKAIYYIGMGAIKESTKKFDLSWLISQLKANREDSLGTIGGKTGKTAVLPKFCKIECGGSSSGASPCYRVLIWLGGACHTGGAPVLDNKYSVISSIICH
jgi:hypothetical protein